MTVHAKRRPRKVSKAKPIRYGRKGQVWHPEFIKYMGSIAQDAAYEGMPDAFVEGGKIQWEAPSNRKSGKYKNTHHKRRSWWRRKAGALGVPPSSSEWISQAAKRLHPTKVKPCKRCGRIMDIRYAYPNSQLIHRVKRLLYVTKDFLLDPLEHISSLVTRLVERYGDQVFRDLPSLLSTSSIKPPNLPPSLADWLIWIEREYIPREPELLSPGAMSNAPDRFDGFHSFNRCCRSKADTGRHPTNLQTYATDRRVFEYWSDGDWIAADRLIGQIRATLSKEPCREGHPGPCSADHIGPLSLGFTHRPEFQFLCKSCNSAKNNRMSLNDVRLLRTIETRGDQVASWHTQAVWDQLKERVIDDETALRLSKVMRDNRHAFMRVLQRIAQRGHFAFLATLLNLAYADHEVTFSNLHVVDHVTRYDQESRKPRETKYAIEQKARRCRIAFESLRYYFTKANRNALVVWPPTAEEELQQALHELGDSESEIRRLDAELARIFSKASMGSVEEQLKQLVQRIPSVAPANFIRAKQHLLQAMVAVADDLSSRWHDERYTRMDLEIELDI